MKKFSQQDCCQQGTVEESRLVNIHHANTLSEQYPAAHDKSNTSLWIEERFHEIDIPFSSKTLIAYRHFNDRKIATNRKYQPDQPRNVGNVFLIMSVILAVCALIFLLFFFVFRNASPDSVQGCLITIGAATACAIVATIMGITAFIFVVIGLAILSRAYKEATKTQTENSEN